MTDQRPAGIADTDVFITRAFDAPRDLVWRFWTEPALLATWFGPTGFHVPIASIDIDMRPGGRWNLTMVDDVTGEEAPFSVILLEVEAPDHFVGVAAADTLHGRLDDITLRVQFHDHGDKTRVTLHQGPFTAEFRDLTTDGWMLSFTKLDQELSR